MCIMGIMGYNSSGMQASLVNSQIGADFEELSTRSAFSSFQFKGKWTSTELLSSIPLLCPETALG